MNKDNLKEAFQKGIHLGPTTSKDRYTCPRTGAHFEFKDMCTRIHAMANKRRKDYGDSFERDSYNEAAPPDPSILNIKQLQSELSPKKEVLAPPLVGIPSKSGNASEAKSKREATSIEPIGRHVVTQVTQEDEAVLQSSKSIKMYSGGPRSRRSAALKQSNISTISRKQKDLHQAITSTRFGQSHRQKQKARNGGDDLQPVMNGGNWQNSQQHFPHQAPVHHQFTTQPNMDTEEGDTQASQERRMSQGPRATQIPLSKINFSKGNFVTQNGNTLQVSQMITSSQGTTASGGKSSKMLSQNKLSKAQLQHTQNSSINPGEDKGYRKVLNSRMIPTNNNYQQPAFIPAASNYQPEPTVNSVDDSLERKSQNANRRILTEPDNKAFGYVPQYREGSQHRLPKNKIGLFDIQQKRAPTISKTQQPGTQANVSKKLSSKSSARQLVAQVQSMSPGKKLKDLPVPVQQQILRGMQHSQQNGPHQSGQNTFYKQGAMRPMSKGGLRASHSREGTGMASKQHTTYGNGRTISGAGFVPFQQKYANYQAQPLSGQGLTGQGLSNFSGQQQNPQPSFYGYPGSQAQAKQFKKKGQQPQQQQQPSYMSQHRRQFSSKISKQNGRVLPQMNRGRNQKGQIMFQQTVHQRNQTQIINGEGEL